MPVKDRTRRRLPRLGVIRLGYKETKKVKRNGRTVEIQYPVQADHFVLTDALELAEVYGEQPRELDVLLPFPDVERNFDANYQVWAGGVLVCQGDGELVQYATPFRVELKPRYNKKREVIGQTTHVYNATGDTWVSNGTARVALEWNGKSFAAGDTVPCPGQARDEYPHCAACKLNGVLKVMMADPRLFRMGYYQISTGSGRNYDTIMGTLEAIPADRLNGIPFKLRMVQEGTSYRDEAGVRHKTSKWFLQLEPDPKFTRRLYRRSAMGLLDERPEVEALPDGLEPEAGEFDEADPTAPPPLAQDQEPDEPAVEGEVMEVEPPDLGPPETESNGVGPKLSPDEIRRLLNYAHNKAVITDSELFEALGNCGPQAYQGSYAQATEAVDAYAGEHAQAG